MGGLLCETDHLPRRRHRNPECISSIWNRSRYDGIHIGLLKTEVAFRVIAGVFLENSKGLAEFHIFMSNHTSVNG